MKWIIKASASAVLSRVPGGRTIYHKLQRACGSNQLNFQESLKRSVEIVDLIRQAGGDLEGAVCVEVGTGWRPLLPIILRLAGAKRTVTFDVNPWLDRDYAWETISAIGQHLEEVAKQLNLPESKVRERFGSWPQGETDRTRLTLANILERFHVEYRCPGDASQTGLSDGSVDFVVSSNVLEHVPPDILEAIHRESWRILKSDGLIAHRFNPQDHFVAVDSSITGANFLKFSKRQWYWFGGSGLAYHNRLRCIQHRLLVEGAGFRVVTERVRRDEGSRQAILNGELIVHPDFARWNADELAADYMWLAARPAAMHENTLALAESTSERIGNHELV